MTTMLYQSITRSWSLVSLILLLVVAAAIVSGLSGGVERTMTVGLINLILVVGLYIFIGNSALSRSVTSATWQLVPTWQGS